MPAREPGAFVIVSGMVLDACEGTEHAAYAVAPDTGNTAVRNEKGHIVAVKGFVRAKA